MRPRTFFRIGLLLAFLGGAALTYSYRATLGLTDPRTEEKIKNLRAFAKLYGYVRWFHPSDAAANTDWGRFATYGVRQVKNAFDQVEKDGENASSTQKP